MGETLRHHRKVLGRTYHQWCDHPHGLPHAVGTCMGGDQFVHATQMIEIGVEVIKEDRIHEDAADLRERRACGWGGCQPRWPRVSEFFAG